MCQPVMTFIRYPGHSPAPWVHGSASSIMLWERAALFFWDKVSLGPGTKIQCVSKPQKWSSSVWTTASALCSALMLVVGNGLSSSCFCGKYLLTELSPALFWFFYHYDFGTGSCYVAYAGLRFHNSSSSAFWAGTHYSHRKKLGFWRRCWEWHNCELAQEASTTEPHFQPPWRLLY